MSFSVFYAVRFSPAPELGEWLNVAVVGEGISERKAGIIVAESLQRIEAAFGPEAVERVKAICSDLSNLIAAMASAHDRGETTQPIPTAMRDHALSLSFSDQIVVFEGKFEEALAIVAKKYISSHEKEAPPQQVEETAATTQKTDADPEHDLARFANSIQSSLAKFSREIFPVNVAKTLEQGQKVIENIVHGQDATTVLVIGADRHLGSALVPRLLNSGKKVRLYDPSLGSETIVEILHPDAIQGISVAEVAKRAGVSQDSVISVLSGAAEKLRVNQKTAGKIRDVAAKLGYRAEETGVIHLASNDIGTAMDGVEVVIYIPESESARGDVKTAHRHALETGKKLAKAAKAGGVKRFVFAAEYPLLHEEDNKVETELKDVSDQEFAVTILRLGELYGHAKSGHWFGDLHDESGRLKDHPTVNILTARAILNGKVSVTDTEPKPFLHVEDAATSITAILDAPSQVVGGQIYDIGSDDQICTLGEIVRLIRQQAPSTDYIVAEGVGSGASTNLILTKIFDELGFAPAETLEEGIAQLVAALKDGTVSNYLSVQTGKVGGAAKTQNANDEAPEIQWESLTMTSIEIEIPGTSTDQSIQKH